VPTGVTQSIIAHGKTMAEFTGQLGLPNRVAFSESRHKGDWPPCDVLICMMSSSGDSPFNHQGKNHFSSGFVCVETTREFQMPPFQHPDPKVGRNVPCPCGSGKKYKSAAKESEVAPASSSQMPYVSKTRR
jgi:hypothetical protein